ncbi:MerR family transcriptional regulator [Fusobacterium sp.]|uniref:MerR family transcriptional regulator n=1 Tax=Fusobacterium sp. TaxID=68766 RepID=UPI002E765EAB|nr:MerR family transcriptional regulator [Fusobacterium sp.]MEE1476235.1 MerR family transcriptional regulator [Fusobacterium sp.]
MEGYLTIGEISKFTGVPISTLRYYDSEGIISPIYKDTKSNYRYYSEMQIPVLRIIFYLKRLGFSNDSIKSHLKTLNYSHTLDLISQLIFDTKEEIKKLQKLHKELVKNSEQIKNLISIEEKINSFFIEESEKIKAIYVTIAESNEEEKFIKAAFKKLSLYTLNTEKELLPIGVCALTIPQENIENKSYRETKLLYMKDIKEFKEKITLPKRKYACMYCKGSLLNKKENIDKLLAWIEDNKLTKSEGDILLHFLAGPGFIKAPEEIMYIIKVPIN